MVDNILQIYYNEDNELSVKDCLMLLIAEKILAQPNMEKQEKFVSATRKRLANVRLTPRNKLAIRLYCAGVEKKEILQALQMGSGSLEYVIYSDVGIAYRKLVMQEFEEQFQMLYGKVLKYMSRALDSNSFDAQDKAARLWATMSGRMTHTVKIERTAEDNVKDLLEGKVIDVTPSTTLQTSDRKVIPDTEQARGDSSLYPE